MVSMFRSTINFLTRVVPTRVILRSVIAFAFIFAVISFVEPLKTYSQEIVDKTVASISDGISTEMISLSDIRWQLALQPEFPLDPARKQDLDGALQTLINQRIFALEARRFPRPAPTEEMIKTEIDRLVRYFGSATAFEKRLRQVGFDSIKDDNFEALIAQRISIENYIDFRFRSFVIVSADEIDRFYRETYVPEFRQKRLGIVMPTIEEKRQEIRELLAGQRIASRIETFLDDAKRRVEIEMLSDI